MKNWLNNLFNPRREDAAAAAAEAAVPQTADLSPADSVDERLRLQNEARSLRMELDNREQALTNLRQEIERLRFRQDQAIQETVATKLEALFSELAAPASQILTQADLLENQGKAVQARDVLSVARRMVRTLERHGITYEGKAGDQAVYDPNRHTPLNTTGGPAPQPGQPVTVRFAGVSYQGKIIYKAIVE